MRRLALIILLLSLPCFGEDSGVAQTDPSVFFKIVAAIAHSKFPELKTNRNDDGTTYHLRGVYYLGQVRRDGQIYSVAQISFVRSSPPGTDVPPPQGHGFVVLLDQSYHVVACGRSDHGFLHMDGLKLMEGKTEVADFESTDVRVRHSGFADLNMPYPFADHITEEEWNSKSPAPPESSPKPKTEQDGGGNAPEPPTHPSSAPTKARATP
jgi:hypothetical protein